MNYVILFILVILNAYSGQEMGNGGDLVVCYKKDGVTITSIELLDFHEGKLDGLNFDFIDKTKKYTQLVSETLTRIERLSGKRAGLYRRYLEEFYNDAKFVKGIILQDIDDSSEIKLKRGCRIEQIAYQLTQIHPNDPPYVISKDLWNKLDDFNKAGLIVHEVIYREFLKFTDQEDSRNVRKFTAYVNSKLFDNTSNAISFYEDTKKWGLGLASYYNYLFQKVSNEDYYQIGESDYLHLFRNSSTNFATDKVLFLGRNYLVNGVGIDSLGSLKCIDLLNAELHKVGGEDFNIINLCQKNNSISSFFHIDQNNKKWKCRVRKSIGINCDEI